MAILKIARMGHGVLARRAAAVEDPTSPEIARLVDDMIETLADAGGVGLAAPQVHVSRRVVIFQIPAARAGEGEDDGVVPLTVLINPRIEPLGEAMEDGWEGCLSIPGFVGKVARWSRIRYSGQQPDGSTLEREAAGFHARAVQHECDHLDGILYPMRMPNLRDFGYSEEIMRRRTGNVERG